MEKEKKEIIVELKKKLNNIYEKFEQRMDRNKWKNAVKNTAEQDRDEILKTAAEFVISHPHIPSSCVRSLLLAAGLRNRPALLSEMYSESIVRDLLEKMTGTDPVRYRLIRPDLPEKELGGFVDAVREAELHLEKKQSYLADRKAMEAEKIFPGHPDVALLRARIACLRYDYSAAERFLHEVFSSGEADARAYELAGDVYAAKKNAPQARSCYMKALELSGNRREDELNEKLRNVTAGGEKEAKKVRSAGDEVRSRDRRGKASGTFRRNRKSRKYLSEYHRQRSTGSLMLIILWAEFF